MGLEQLEKGVEIDVKQMGDRRAFRFVVPRRSCEERQLPENLVLLQIIANIYII